MFELEGAGERGGGGPGQETEHCLWNMASLEQMSEAINCKNKLRGGGLCILLVNINGKSSMTEFFLNINVDHGASYSVFLELEFLPWLCTYNYISWCIYNANKSGI
jgi:hypothetical protein